MDYKFRDISVRAVQFIPDEEDVFNSDKPMIPIQELLEGTGASATYGVDYGVPYIGLNADPEGENSFNSVSRVNAGNWIVVYNGQLVTIMPNMDFKILHEKSI
jgi:hypothetical protein